MLGTFGKVHYELAICKLDLCHIAPAGQMGSSGFDMSKGNRSYGLSQGHIRLHNRFAVRQIEGMFHQEVRIKDDL